LIVGGGRLYLVCLCLGGAGSRLRSGSLARDIIVRSAVVSEQGARKDPDTE